WALHFQRLYYILKQFHTGAYIWLIVIIIVLDETQSSITALMRLQLTHPWQCYLGTLISSSTSEHYQVHENLIQALIHIHRPEGPILKNSFCFYPLQMQSRFWSPAN
ncbi:hypothetical protein ACJX0J_032379, partial [Zea mays]